MGSNVNKYILALFILLIAPISAGAASNAQNEEAKTIRTERNYIRKGNDLYNQKRYAEAEVEYRKALNENKDSELGLYNLAVSLLRQGGNTDPNSKENPMNQATSLLNDLVQVSKNKQLTAKAYYNLGNIAFNQQQFQQSVELYKNSLRRNPDDEQARQNLRLAQKKLQEQQNQDQNKDKDKDKDKDKENKDQNKDQNKDKNKDQNQNKQNQNNQDQKKPEEKNEQQSGGGQDNSEQILNAVQNNEKDTQQKVNALRTKAQENERRRTRNQW